jgi:hypothetical protein
LSKGIGGGAVQKGWADPPQKGKNLIK